eukprot:TRINITY_DN3076_c0_g1_i1.p1 TRINITY_DN3076_c0_g1~~TRINITY_DN3076_c0_g1_i1.p1  ORF type:complete len:118 (-),score=31.28 TRINITY_DN3076_c0_g1_i1:66-419(-)
MATKWSKNKLFKAGRRKTPQPSTTSREIERDLRDLLEIELNGAKLCFEDNEWHIDGVSTASGSGGGKEARKLRAENKALQAKVKVLVDMLTMANLDITALEEDLAASEKELSRLKKK